MSALARTVRRISVVRSRSHDRVDYDKDTYELSSGEQMFDSNRECEWPAAD
jgi:hypothetical protein